MKLILRFKQFLKRKKGEHEVWDTSALSTYPEKVREHVKNGVNVVVTDSSVRELSVARHKYDQIREIHDFIINNLKAYVTKDKMKSWTVDDQIGAITYELFNRGLKIKLITCDKNQAYNARLRGLNVLLLPGKPRTHHKTEVPVETTSTKKLEENITLMSEDEISVPCITKGKEIYISVKCKISVYNSKGKRRIGKDNLIPVLPVDVLVYMNNKYVIKNVEGTKIILKKMK